jgi:hypothetical protein
MMLFRRGNKKFTVLPWSGTRRRQFRGVLCQQCVVKDGDYFEGQ